MGSAAYIGTGIDPDTGDRVDTTAGGLRTGILVECEPPIRGTATSRTRPGPDRSQPPRPPHRSIPGQPHLAPSAAELQRLLRAIVEVLDGRRSLQNLQPHLTLPCYQAIRNSLRRESGYPTYTVHSVHTCVPAPNVLEACATVRRGGRARALVLRIEGLPHDGRRWRCTDFRLL